MPPTNGTKPKSSMPDEATEQSYSPLWLNDIFNPNYRSNQSGIIPPYWSMGREYWLRWFYQQSDPVKLALGQLEFIFMAVPLKVLSDDPDNDTIAQSAQIQQELLAASWEAVGSRFIADFGLHDNGAFLEVLEGFDGDGREIDPLEPIEPTSLGGGIFVYGTGLRNLDSLRCQRTGDPIYPVLYQHTDGKQYKLHYTRVFNLTRMPSSDPKLLGVGMSPISAAIDSAIIMDGALRWGAERVGVGALPNQLLFGVQFDPRLLEKAIDYARMRTEDLAHSQFQQIPFIVNEYADQSIKASDMIHSVKLDNLPPDWDLKLDWQLWWDTFALAVGIDSNEFRRATTVGETKAEAQLADEKGDQKGKAWFFRKVGGLLTRYFCTSDVYAEFDFFNDRQDQDDALIMKTEQEAYAIALQNGTLTREIIWRQMLEKGQITQEDYEVLTASQAVENEAEVEPQPDIEAAKALLKENRAKKKDLADDYQVEVDRLVELALNGEITQDGFEAEMTNLVEQFGTAAFADGAGIEGELTEEEQDGLDERLAVILLALLSFSAAIYGGTYEGNFSSAMSRADLWGNSIESVQILGQTYNRNNPVLEWQFTPGKEHCTDCATFNGQRKRASEWRAGGKLPRTTDLQCRGYNCGCRLVEV